MKRLIVFIFLAVLLALPAAALDITVPEAPEAAQALIPEDRETFGQGLLIVLRDAAELFLPDLKEASGVCLGLAAVAILTAVLGVFPGSSARAVSLAGAVAASAMLLEPANSLIRLGAETVEEVSEYGKLLLPTMTAALAAQGGITTSAALYTGTALFDAILSTLISKVLTPLIYLFLGLAAAGAALGTECLKRLGSMLKSILTWFLKTVIYVFTGYIGITGVVSGATDAATLKVTRLTVSSAVPVIGGILADASEAILVSAGTVKNAAGVYGLFAILAICLSPFLKIAAHYLLLKATGAVCGIFAGKELTGLIADFSSAMGILLGMTGAVCFMLLISTVCFMKGV